MTILVTGFEPFGSVADNPSQRIVEHLAKRTDLPLHTVVLPVAYTEAAEKIINLIEAHQSQAVLMLGVAQSRKEISLERIAININDARLADNTGNMMRGQQIVENAPVGYWSTLPLDSIYNAIEKLGIRVKFSNHAGAYLCNHVFYRIRHYYEKKGTSIPAGFIHVPDMGNEAPKMLLTEQISAIEAGIHVLIKQLNPQSIE